MQILFCDNCNQSIPQTDLEEGRAGFNEGQVLCFHHFVEIEASVSDDDAPGSSESEIGRQNGAGWFVGVLVLVAGSLGFVARDLAVSDSLPMFGEAKPSPEAEGAAFRRYQELRSAVDGLQSRLKEAVDADKADRDRFAGKLTGFEDTVHGLEDVVRQSEHKMIMAQGELAKGLDSDREILKRVREDLEALKPAIASLTAKARVPAVRDKSGPPKPVVSSSPPTKGPLVVEEEPANPARDRWIRTLKSKDPGGRFTALVELTGIGGKKSAFAIADLLTDEDPFLRSYAAHSLGRLGISATIPNLIDALADQNVSVRQAVFEALSQMTGEGFGFRADGKASDRKKALRKWRAWLRETS